MAPSRAIRPFQHICASCRQQAIAKRRPFTQSSRLTSTEDSSLPRVATPSFWSSLIPKPFRRQSPELVPDAPITPKPRSRFLTPPRDWNPFTIFIFLGLLAGSNAIQILSLRNDTLSYTRKTEAKLSLLREVVRKVKDGEEVDVRKALGTGDEEAEREWEEMMKELESTDGVVEGWKRKEEKRKAKAEERARAREGGGRKQEQDPQNQNGTEPAQKAEDNPTGDRRPKFMM